MSGRVSLPNSVVSVYTVLPCPGAVLYLFFFKDWSELHAPALSVTAFLELRRPECSGKPWIWQHNYILGFVCCFLPFCSQCLNCVLASNEHWDDVFVDLLTITSRCSSSRHSSHCFCVCSWNFVFPYASFYMYQCWTWSDILLPSFSVSCGPSIILISPYDPKLLSVISRPSHLSAQIMLYKVNHSDIVRASQFAQKLFVRWFKNWV